MSYDLTTILPAERSCNNCKYFISAPLLLHGERGFCSSWRVNLMSGNLFGEKLEVSRFKSACKYFQKSAKEAHR